MVLNLCRPQFPELPRYRLCCLLPLLAAAAAATTSAVGITSVGSHVSGTVAATTAASESAAHDTATAWSQTLRAIPVSSVQKKKPAAPWKIAWGQASKALGDGRTSANW